MNSWKVILATLVIFGAGIFTGSLITRQVVVRPVLPGTNQFQVFGPSPYWLQEPARRRMQDELKLTPQQSQHVERILTESRERIASLWGVVRPEVEGERREVRERIHRVLNPEQIEKFDKLIRTRQRRNEERSGVEARPREFRGSSSNRPPTNPPSRRPAGPPRD